MTDFAQRRRFVRLLLAHALLGSQSLPALAADSHAGKNRYSRSVKAAFDDVFSDLEFAITEHNYRITGINSIGRAIVDRADQQSDFPLASVVHFCNIEAAREILEISMDYLLLMPCRITVREIDEGRVHVEAQLLPEGDPQLAAIAIRVNVMLKAITDFAAGDW